MKFLLDTDTCIYALKQNENVLRQLLSTAREDVSISVITEAELRTGAAKSSSPLKTLHRIENFLRALTLIDFTSDDAIAYSGVRARSLMAVPLAFIKTSLESRESGESSESKDCFDSPDSPDSLNSLDCFYRR